MLIGALAQSIPDVDFIAALWNDTASNLLAHRGFTHSIFFDFIATFGFAFLAEHFHRSHRIGFRKWVLFFGIQISVHIFIDLFNNYGVGLFEPFSHKRYSWDAMFVADPFFSVWPAIAFIVLLALKARLAIRRFWWRFGVVLPFIYLGTCSLNKISVDKELKKLLAEQKIAYQDFLTTPTPLNNLLWYIAVKKDSGYYIGYRSVFDKKYRLDLHYFPAHTYLIRSVADQEDLQHLIRFSKGYYTVENWHDTLVFNDLRFGQMIGWFNPHEHFVFHYFLRKDIDNKLVVQRGRFAKWDLQTTESLINRIRGN